MQPTAYSASGLLKTQSRVLKRWEACLGSRGATNLSTPPGAAAMRRQRDLILKRQTCAYPVLYISFFLYVLDMSMTSRSNSAAQRPLHSTATAQSVTIHVHGRFA
eukprot:6213707-Pleurochrysis_carterae.AAC.4